VFIFFVFVAACQAPTEIESRASRPIVLPPPGFPPAGPVVWDSVLQNVTVQGDVVVPVGKQWLIGPNVKISGNLRTEGGTIGMRPGSSLQFVGANRNQYVGGGLTFTPSVANDIGIWITGSGVLDIQGTPKQGWNRTGTHTTWAPGDEYWITPTAQGDIEMRRWYPGQPIPQVDPRVPSAEVINVTRDILIQGPGHIFINSSSPQRIEYVRLERMGIAQHFTKKDLTTGRYAIHFHFSGEGSRGSVVRGVAAVNSEGRVYVPHESHGITFEDNVSIGSFGEGFWWDHGHFTNDVSVDRILIAGANFPEEISGRSSFVASMHLGEGNGNRMTNSVATASWGSTESHGYQWEPGTTEIDSKSDAWAFVGNVSHNNGGTGLRFWTNERDPHLVENHVSYRNRIGVETGAYNNSVRYSNLLLVEEELIQHSTSSPQDKLGRQAGYDGLTILARSGPALIAGGRRLQPLGRNEFIDCSLVPSPGFPKVRIDPGETPFLALFRRCGLTPSDIEWSDPSSTGMEGSNVIIEHEDGTKWEITVSGGRVEVSVLQ
jgi:hypothetical protein